MQINRLEEKQVKDCAESSYSLQRRKKLIANNLLRGRYDKIKLKNTGGYIYSRLFNIVIRMTE